MAGKKRVSLIANLIILIGLGIASLTVLQVAVLSRLAKNDSRKDHIENYVVLTNSIRSSLEHTIDGYFKQLNPYVNSDVMKSGIFNVAGNWLQNNPQIRAREYDYVMLADAQGLSFNDNGTRTDISDRDYLKAIMFEGKERYIDNPVVSRTTGNKVVHFARRINGVNGKVFAMVAGVINVDVLLEPIKELNIPEDIWMFIIDHDGNVIYHPAAEEDGNFITNPGEGHEDLAEISRRMVDGESGYAWINSYTGSKEDLLVYSGIEGTSWGMGFLVPGNVVDRLGKKIGNTAVAFGIITTIIILIIGVLVLSVSLKPLKVVKNAITGISQGNADLTQRIQIHSNNEIGQVVQGFNNFTEKLQTIISDVKASKNELGIAGEDMSSTAQDTASSITQIIANIDSFRQQLDHQKGSVDQTAEAVDEISANINSMNQMIENQSAGVIQASSAVEEMIGNINSVSTSVEKMNSSFGELQSHSQEGFSQLETVNTKVQAIEAQSVMLQDANVAIANIAEQTNLLAMNAAIEAAHAGEAGKGFAVVADEIRKLSETSSQQSTQITNQLNEIMESIKEVVSASTDASKTFALVSQELTDTDQLVIQIKTAMAEQNEGSKQIIETLKMMNDSSQEVRSASDEMQNGNKLILAEVQHLQNVTISMRSSMDEMASGARRINETGTVLTEVADRMKDSIIKIGKQIDEFKV
ncbi:MAG: HAMP domain-containing protein [Treponema sp.]|nr:HAMP domain-containing protein [Treponema sp.]